MAGSMWPSGSTLPPSRPAHPKQDNSWRVRLSGAAARVLHGASVAWTTTAGG
eukprot:CAMPEP_0171131536 /NCGR_PEP_ID=MMETSP0766_2-20121228/122935_1 /TAXON_ID=439317 /ORGANISM="Gambierdiscus australes, Strain CAWD 149" /LENGTH=51 /DNA_ID=CAMNT_0011594843 /DNA_START=42 /DNA_END=194 /DNA_ORIENTATION=+